MKHNNQQHTGSRVLLGIADIELQKTIRETLEIQDYEVLVADNARDAVRTLRTHAPKVVILEVALPFHQGNFEYDGIDPLEVITDVDPFLPVMLLAPENVTIDHASALMADMIVRIPVPKDELLENLETLLSETLRQRSLRKSAQLAILQ
ncbi:MAG TPA: response regulator [Verrucomicrobiae bacterium]|nr:response regulator [Verrucomicrobiae bacterium]